MQILEKRTADNRLFDIDFSLLLDTAETIASITSITADQGVLTFSSQLVNPIVLTYPSGRQAQIGKAVRVLIGGGLIPPGQSSLLCVVRVLVATTLNPAIEATVILKLTDRPVI